MHVSEYLTIDIKLGGHWFCLSVERKQNLNFVFTSNVTKTKLKFVFIDFVHFLNRFIFKYFAVTYLFQDIDQVNGFSSLNLGKVTITLDC